MKNRQEPPKLPSLKRTVSVISGGDEVNGVAYTTTKKVSKVTVTHEKQVRQVLEEDSITFDDADVDVVNEMQVDDKLVPKARTLSGFDNSSIVTKGKIMLTTFAEGVVKDTKFQVINMDMAYNMILDRPWIHKMDVVPSTLHQVIKFPSQWEIRQIRGDQQASKNVDSRPDTIQEPEKNKNIKTIIEELEAVVLFIHWSNRKVYIGTNLSLEMKDMIGIPPEVMTHKLNEDPTYPSVKQKKRKQGSFKNQVIQDEQSQFEWTEECQQALKNLKTYLSNPPLLAKPKDGERLLIYLTVSKMEIPKEENIEADTLANLASTVEVTNEENAFVIQ
uniref:Uncharacterized protein n=2 Tax=Nicotiana TaxID=4085 RepID=A0A1S3YFB6_TOBAC|nr:PREDICTED: uncharacterized protein LOC104221185 [Nicotiana sylvestris]XP_016450713.1 PREDICTED: uncharacterized protein LOC107775493 [Nicotiana tabacum]